MLKLEDTILIVIDVQSKLWNVIFEKEVLLENLQKMIKGTQLLGMPIVLTEQNPKGLGPTMPEILQLIPEVQPISKFSFSCCQDKNFQQAIEAAGRKQVLICGIESHICVYQTTLELLSKGYAVQVIADCISSRLVRNRDIALMRMQSEGAKLTASEMILYELLQTAESPKFKEMLKVIK